MRIFWCTSHLIFRSLVWSVKQELSIACIHISTQSEFSMPCNYYVIKCICESFFLFLFIFLPFHFNFLYSWVSRAIFLAFHINCAFSLTHSLYISLMQSGKRSSSLSLSCDQDGGMKTIKLRVLLAHVED